MAEPGKLSLGDRRIAVWLGILTFVTYAWFHAGGGWNQNSQFDLTRAIVERHTFAIDAYADNTGDVSHHGEHVYSNKSPGLSWIAALPYAVVHAFEDDPDDVAVATMNQYLMTIFCVALPGALIPPLLYRIGRRRGFGASWSAVVALAAGLATQLLPYSTLFMLHVPSGFLLLIALTASNAAVGGFAAGLGAATNLLAAPAVLLFAIPQRDRVRWFVGAISPLVLLAIYQKICFGSFFATSVAAFDPRFVSRGAVYGVIGRPSLEAAIGITVSPYRGLFYFAPVLIMALAGLVIWFRSRSLLREWIAIVTLSVFFFAVNVSFNGWEAGFGIGARYLVPLIPLWGVAMLYCRRWLRPIFVALAIVSFAINFTATAVDPQVSGSVPRPLTQYLLPLLIRGEFSPRVPLTPPWSSATFTGHTSVNRLTADEAIVFAKHPPGSDASEWASFNLGELSAGAGDARSLIPIAIVIVLGATAILVMARRLDRDAMQ